MDSTQTIDATLNQRIEEAKAERGVAFIVQTNSTPKNRLNLLAIARRLGLRGVSQIAIAADQVARASLRSKP